MHPQEDRSSALVTVPGCLVQRDHAQGTSNLRAFNAEVHALTAMRAMVKAAELMSSRTASANASAYSCVKAVPTPCDCPAWRQDSAGFRSKGDLSAWLEIELLVQQCRAERMKP